MTASSKSHKQTRVLPGFGFGMSLGLGYMTLIMVIPFGVLIAAALRMGWTGFSAKALLDPRVLAAYQVSFGSALTASVLITLFGFVVSWVLIRYRFPGRRMLDASVDIPFALPTSVSGIALTTLYASTGWIGQWLAPLGIQVSYALPGIVIALMLISLPFAVRTMQPAIMELDTELEAAAASLGASPGQIMAKITLPTLAPAILTAFSVAFARSLGEFGSVYFISGNLPFKTEIAPLMIIMKLEQYDYEGAAAIGAVMLLAAFVLLLIINIGQWMRRRYATA